MEQRRYTMLCRREISEIKAHRRKQGDGDLMIVEPLSRSNAGIGNLSKAKKDEGVCLYAHPLVL